MNDISQLDIKEAFMMLQTYLDEEEDLDENGEKKYEELKETYNKARYGITIKFDLYDYLNGVMQMKSKIGKIIVRSKKNKMELYDISDFWTELEQRTIIMKRWLKNNTEDDLPYDTYNIK